MIRFVLYTRPGCHLCDQMKAVVRRVAETHPLSVEEIDISGDAELERVYGEAIPVLMMDGRKVAKYRISEAELVRMLTARSDGARGPGG